jgi:hypothetical protein
MIRQDGQVGSLVADVASLGWILEEAQEDLLAYVVSEILATRRLMGY